MSGLSCSALSPALATFVTHGGEKHASMRHKISVRLCNPLTPGNLIRSKIIRTHSPASAVRTPACGPTIPLNAGNWVCSVKSQEPDRRSAPCPAVVIGTPMTYHG